MRGNVNELLEDITSTFCASSLRIAAKIHARESILQQLKIVNNKEIKIGNGILSLYGNLGVGAIVSY